MSASAHGFSVGEADRAVRCSVWLRCKSFLDSFSAEIDPDDPTQFERGGHVCYCHASCARRHPDTARRAGSTYVLPKGWCGFAIRLDAAEMERLGVFDTYHRAFHGLPFETAAVILDPKTKRQLLMPGDIAPNGFEIPVRGGHIGGTCTRRNPYTGDDQDFDPNQIFTSPAIEYCSYPPPKGGIYCTKKDYDGHSFLVAFQASWRALSAAAAGCC